MFIADYSQMDVYFYNYLFVCAYGLWNDKNPGWPFDPVVGNVAKLIWLLEIQITINKPMWL